MKLTDTRVKSIKPQLKDKEHFEDRAADGSFGVRVTPKGKRTFFVYYKSPVTGKARRMTLKPAYPQLSLKDARIRAEEIFSTVAAGGDPVGKIQAKSVASTVADYWDLYTNGPPVEEGGKKIKSTQAKKAPNTIIEENRKWERVVGPILGDMQLEDINKPLIRSILRPIMNRGSGVQANRTLSFIKMFLNWCEDQDDDFASPARKIKKIYDGEMEKERSLENEIPQLFLALDQIPQDASDILKMILLTGQRPGEVMAMKYSDILDKDGKSVWYQRKNKTSKPHYVPLTKAVGAILARRAKENTKYWGPEAPCNNDWIFPSDTATGHIRRIYRSTEAANDLMGLDSDSRFTPHDLRRTCRTIMGDEGVLDEIGEKVMNHSLEKIKRTYNKSPHLPEKLAALQKVAGYVHRQISGYSKPQLVQKVG